MSSNNIFCYKNNFFIILQHENSPDDKIGAWFIRAKSLTEEDDVGNESCPKEGCPNTNVLKNIPKLGPEDTVFILFHGNAMVIFLNQCNTA